MKSPASYLLIIFLLISCKTTENKSQIIMKKDHHSYSNVDKVQIKHIHLDLRVDFESKILKGYADITINNFGKADSIILDTYGLQFKKIVYEDNHDAKFTIGEFDEVYGSPLSIKLNSNTKKIRLYYATSDKASGLQWLNPEQTLGKKHPFLFSQSQAILARSWLPCQDTPGLKFTYSAKITVPKELLPVMSAENPKVKNTVGVYEFNMPQPIPSYLMAIAVGDIEFRQIGENSGVYAEPAMLEKAVYELADMPAMIKAAENLYGPYQWGEYDVIILPPSFPFGGMENPRLTFATPTIIAGDRSLVALIAHELAHSWSGNLVTNSTWDDFWLNEGFTVYFESRITEAIYGLDYANMLTVLGKQDLDETIEELNAENPDDTKLLLNLNGRNPDDGMTDIAYEKGRFFLKTCENAVGREKWDAFLKQYFNEHAFGSMTTEDFIKYFNENLIKGDKELADKIKIDDWIYKPGLPENFPQIESIEFEKVNKQIILFESGTSATELNTQNYTTHHWLHFLRNLPDSLSQEQMIDLDKAFNFTNSGNSEILCVWFQKAIDNNYQPAMKNTDTFLKTVGRRKFLKPIYTKLAKTPNGLEHAREIFKEAKPGYHSVSYNTIQEILYPVNTD